MLLVENFLTHEQLAKLKGILASTRYVDGGRTGGAAGSMVKNNLQTDESDPHHAEANRLILDRLLRCEALQSYALPHIVTPIRFAKYGMGMQYGNHVDAAIHNVPNAILRTDLSFTLFLTGPADYEGGELVITSGGLQREVKANAGDMIVYPSGTVHRVNEIRSGWREVAIGWIQSLVADHAQRQILYDILRVRTSIFESGGKSSDFDLLNTCYVNLQRMWANP